VGVGVGVGVAVGVGVVVGVGVAVGLGEVVAVCVSVGVVGVGVIVVVGVVVLVGFGWVLVLLFLLLSPLYPGSVGEALMPVFGGCGGLIFDSIGSRMFVPDRLMSTPTSTMTKNAPNRALAIFMLGMSSPKRRRKTS